MLTYCQAALEAVCYQTKDLIEAMQRDGARMPSHMRVDGGMTVNNWLMQFLADILNIPVEKNAYGRSECAWCGLFSRFASRFIYFSR